MAEPIVALEIGTSRTVALVGERCQGDGLKVTGIGWAPTIGVCKGIVTDVNQAASSVKKAIAMAQESSGVTINTVILAVSGPGISTSAHFGQLAILPKARQITAADIAEVRERAESFDENAGERVLHHLHQHYQVDEQPGIRNPEGMCGSKLELDLMAITAQNNAVENFVSVTRQAGLAVEHLIFSAAADSVAALTTEQKEAGVALVNFGGGKIDYTVFCGGVMVMAGCYGVGGEHITSDLMRAFTLSHAVAEELKKSCAAAIVQPDAAQRRESIRASFATQERQVSVKAVQTVTSARIDEALRDLRTIFNNGNVIPHLGAGIVFVGGCTALPGLLELAQRTFGVPCGIGAPVNIAAWDVPCEQPAALTTTVGLILWAARERATQEQPAGLFKRLFGRFS